MAGVGSYKQIVFEKQVHSKGVEGNWDTVEKTRYPVWAEVKTTSNNRIYKDGQTALVDIVRFRVRFNPAIAPNVDWQIIYSGRKHTIHSIEKDKEKRFYYLINAMSIGVN